MSDGWKARAACRGRDPSLFFPDAADTPAIVAAQQICAGCSVRVECYEFAVSIRERQGIWGGVVFGAMYRDRQRVLREARQARQAVS